MVIQAEKYINFFSYNIALPNHIDVDDIKQEMRMRVFKACEGYDTTRNFNSYFGTVLKQQKLVILKTLKRKQNKTKKIIDRLCILNTYYKTGVYNVSYNNNLIRTVALENMPNDRARNVFKYFEAGKTIEEIMKIVEKGSTLVYHIKNNEIKPAIKSAIESISLVNNFCSQHC